MKTIFSAGGLRPRARAARASPAAGGQGELRRARHRSPVGRGGLQPRARAAREAPGGQGGAIRAPEWRAQPRHPVGRGAPAACQSGARDPGPRIPFFESTYPEMQRKHITEVNEYQS